jgi:hypothetical protein
MSGTGEFRTGSLDRRGVDVGQNHRGAVFGERSRGGQSHTGPGAGDQRNLVGEVV